MKLPTFLQKGGPSYSLALLFYSPMLHVPMFCYSLCIVIHVFHFSLALMFLCALLLPYFIDLPCFVVICFNVLCFTTSPCFVTPMLHAPSCFLVFLSCFTTMVLHCFSHVLLLLWFATPMFYALYCFATHVRHCFCASQLSCFTTCYFVAPMRCYSHVSLLPCFITLLCFRYLFSPCCFIVPLCFAALVLHYSCVLLHIVFCCSLFHIGITPLYFFEFLELCARGLGC